MRIMLISILSFLTISSKAASIIPVACDFLAISNAVKVTAQEGDTVLIGPGSCVMSNFLLIDRNISFKIQGSGTNLTSLRAPTGSGDFIFWPITSSTNLFEISHMDIVASANSGFDAIIFGNVTTFRGPFRAHHLQMTNLNGRGIRALGGAFGLADYNYMVAQVGALSAQFTEHQGMATARSWTNDIPFGTTNAMYMENNVFINLSGGGNGFVDAYEGAQIVFRYNYCSGVSFSGVHGYDSGRVGTRSWEFYNNVFSNCNGALVFHIRSGSGYMYGNQVFGTTTLMGILDHYRTCPPSHPYVVGGSNTFLPTGQAGKSFTHNFSGASSNDFPNGAGNFTIYPANATNNQTITVGFTSYRMLTNLANATSAMANVAQSGGGAVKIGDTAELTISNLWNAINVTTGAYGTNGSYYNVTAGGAPAPYLIGHDYLAFDRNTTNLVLTNRLDTYADQYGWPANQQPGTIKAYALTGSNYTSSVTFTNAQQTWMMVASSNYINGVLTGFTVPATLCSGYETNFVMAGRDYTNSTTGLRTNYTALVYPHPLAGGSTREVRAVIGRFGTVRAP